MLFTVILPALFIFTFLVGVAMIVNGVRGLAFAHAVAPDLSGETKGAIRPVTGDSARRWGTISAFSGLLFLIVPIVGLNLVFDFMHSPAYVKKLLPPPESYEIVYSLVNEDSIEISYGFEHLDRERLVRHYRTLLLDGGWVLTNDTPILLGAVKNSKQVSLSFVGRQLGDNRPYQSKVIVVFRESS